MNNGTVKYIKICGIHNTADALMCIKQGANAIGVIVGALHKTEDALSAGASKTIFSSLTLRRLKSSDSQATAGNPTVSA